MSTKPVYRRSAIAMNNMGVSLFQRRAYRQGLKTFKDSILVMKLNLGSPTQDVPNVESTISTRIAQATKRLANPEPMPSTFQLNILSHDGAFHQHDMNSFLLGKGQSSPTAFLVRIESDGLVVDGEEDHELESAILLYNYGIAHMCMSKLSKKPSTSNQRYEGALRLFSMSFAIMSGCVGGILACAAWDDDIADMSEERVLMVVAVLRNSVQVLLELGREDKAREAYHKLLRVEKAIADVPDQEQAAAAA